MNGIILTILLVISGIIIIGLSWGFIEAMCLKVTRDKLILGPSEGDPDLRILFFSDLHREFCPIPASRVINVIRKEHASKGLDAVIFGGDICNGKGKHVLRGLPYLNAIGDVCKELSIPYMAVTGNHDWGADGEELCQFNFDNINHCIKYLKSRRDGQYMAIGGVLDTGRHERLWMAPTEPSAGIPYKKYILISHNPDLALHMPPQTKVKIDAMISGHIHGGQIRTPFGIEFRLRHDELPYMGVISGIHEVNGIKLYISKGLGCVFLPFRFFARPEINIIEISA